MSVGERERDMNGVRVHISIVKENDIISRAQFRNVTKIRNLACDHDVGM